MAEIPKKLSVRLDEPTRAAISEYATANGMNTSQAVRVLLALAMRGEQDADTAFRQAVFKEGVILGLARLREHFTSEVQGMARRALAGLERVDG